LARGESGWKRGVISTPEREPKYSVTWRMVDKDAANGVHGMTKF
jgi:hypothetical protein